MGIVNGTAKAIYKQGKKTIKFKATEHALNYKSTEALLKEAEKYAMEEQQASDDEEQQASGDEEQQDDASGDEKPQEEEASGVPTQGLPMPLTVGNHVEPQIEQSTPMVIDVDEWMAESSSTPQSSSTPRIIRRREVSGSNSSPITIGKRSASGSSGSNSKRKRKRSKKKIDRKDLLLEIHEVKDKKKEGRGYEDGRISKIC